MERPSNLLFLILTVAARIVHGQTTSFQTTDLGLRIEKVSASPEAKAVAFGPEMLPEKL